MASALSSPDVMSRAVLEKAPPTGAVLTPEQQAAKNIREKAAESNPRSALEFLQQKTPIEQRKITEANDRNIGIGTERSPDGTRKRDAGEARRFTDANKYTQISKDFLEKGYDGLSNSADKKIIRDGVEMSIKAWPEADAWFSGISVADRQAMLESIAKNPEYIAKLRGDFDESMAVSVPDLPTEVREKFEHAKSQESAKQAEISRNDSDKKSVDSRLDQFEDRTTTGGRLGTKLEELQKLDKELPAERARKNQLQDELFLAQAELSSYEQKLNASLQRGNGDAEATKNNILTKRGQVRKLEGEVAEIEAKENRRAALEGERGSLRERRQQLEEERARFDTELSELTKQRIVAQAEFDTARLNRVSQEQDYVDRLRNGFSESTFKYLQEKIAAADDVQRQLIEEEKARTTDPGEKAVLDGILNRWEEKKTEGAFRKREVSKLNLKKINEDFGSVMIDMDAGPKKIMKEMLMKGGMSDVDATTKLNDPAFVDKMQPQVIEALVTKRIQTGKLTEDDARRIIEHPKWGKAVIDKAIERRKEIRDAIAELQGKGLLRGGMAEWLREKSGGSKLKFLLILLGIAALGVGPAAMALSSAMKEQ